MEQKAITYKTIKGMARDMAVSSGSNDFSYENYNIRITTRGKEDSLVVTNEKGTESNIIASREVIKTVNNIFIGKEPSFYNTITEVEVSDLKNYSYIDLYRFPNTSNTNTDLTIDDLIPISEKEYTEGKIYNKDNKDTSTFEEYIRPGEKPDPLNLYDIYYKDEHNNYVQATEDQYDDESITLYTHKSISAFYTIKPTNEEVVLSTVNDDICFGINVEYPIDKTEPNELIVKGRLTISENPTEKDNENYYLLGGNNYTEQFNFTIPIGKSNQLMRKSIKDIVLNGGYYSGATSYDIYNADYDKEGNRYYPSLQYTVKEVTSETFDNLKAELYTVNSTGNIYTILPDDAEFDEEEVYYVKEFNEGIVSKWMPSYEYLYNKLLIRDFEFNGFGTESNEFICNDGDSFLLLSQNLNKNNIKFDNGKFVENGFYSVGILSEAIDDGNEMFYTETSTNKLGFLKGYVLADKYPTSTTMDFCSQNNYIRIPFYKKDSNNEFKTFAGYFEFKYEFSYLSYLNGNTNFESVKLNDYYLVDSEYNSIFLNEKNSPSLMCKANFGNYSQYSTVITPVLSLTIQCFANTYFAREGYTTNKSERAIYFLPEGDDNYAFKMYSDWGPLFISNIVESSYSGAGNNHSFPADAYNRSTTTGGFPIKVFEEGNDSVVTKNFTTNPFLFGEFTGSTYSKTADDSVSVSTSNGVDFTLGSSSGYNCIRYSVNNTLTSNINIESITSENNDSNKYVIIHLKDSNNDIDLIYNVDTHTIKDSSTDCPEYKILKVTSEKYKTPFIFYIKEDDYNWIVNRDREVKYNAGKILYNIKNTNSLYNYSVFNPVFGNTTSMIDNELNSFGAVLNGSSVLKMFKNDSGLLIGTANDKIFENITIEVYDKLPIFYNGDIDYQVEEVEDENDFESKKSILYVRTGDSPSYTYTKVLDTDTYDSTKTYCTTYNTKTKVDSIKRQLYVNPTFDKIMQEFGFTQDKFSFEFEVDDFRLSCSNNDWDKSFKYKFIDTSPNDNTEYIKQFKPMRSLDTNVLNLKQIAENNIIQSVNIEVTEHDESKTFFNVDDNEYNFNDNLHITIKDKLDRSVVKTKTLGEWIIGVSAAELGVANHFNNNHDFYISKVFYYIDNEPTLVIDKNKTSQDKAENEVTVNETSYEMLIDEANQVNYVKQTIESSDFVSIMPYSFEKNNYQNKFFSISDLDILIPTYGEYSALKIPGRILGSCTIDDYVVLFFHYSSPALNFYKKVDDRYELVTHNTSDLKELYTYRRGTNGNIFDLAIDNRILLKDDNNDYVNGKNQDYIVCLKYIDARPDNKENEWSTVVSKISNAPTQILAQTGIIEKKPYYSADILFQGDLGFNANYGIETIGYYESKNVIKVYWTDGKNQPRMINIMTPNAIREGVNTKWDSKSFDFVQEIKGNEQVNITKQFGGGAFPAGTVQYYFTYANQGGAESNPFWSSPIYYTSQSAKGNAPTKITDNTFKIELRNLKTNFDYINIYSVVRTSKDMQTLCKRVINVSMKNYNYSKGITFTDNNLLGEIVDSSYLLMLQGTPISALTMAEKDNTLFLGNINKLQKNLTPDEKAQIRELVDIVEATRAYQDYDPNDDEWYENVIKDVARTDNDGKLIIKNGNRVIDKTISLEGNSSEIKTFMYNEYYRLGIQLQDKYGRWSDPVFIKDVKCNNTISNTLTYKTSEDNDSTKRVSRLQSRVPYFKLIIKDKKSITSILNKYGFVRVRPVIVYPNISSRNVLCQGLLSPTMFNYADRSMNAPFNFSSYFFRPYPPAIGKINTDGSYKHDVDFEIGNGCGYPIEYRHGYPITGYHDAIEEGLANSGIDDVNAGGYDVAQMVSDYLGTQTLKRVKLTSQTPGWWVNSYVYLREGVVSVSSPRNVTYQAGSKIYQVSSSSNRGHVKILTTLTTNKNDNNYGNGGSLFDPPASTNKLLGNFLTGASGYGSSPYTKCRGFNSHIHYFKNALAHFAMISFDNVISAVNGDENFGNEVVISVGDTKSYLTSSGLIFNEGNITYIATYPLTVQVIPLSYVSKKKHRGLKRKVYSCDIIVESANIKCLANANGADYIDSGDSSSDIASKAYFALNNGEIQCANGNKNYNIYSTSVIDAVDKTYNSSEINVSSRKQSLFYVDESVCTLNSPEIEYNPTVQKIDLSNYKLNVVGAANITGYKNKIVIDAETPPAALGTIVAEGFKHEPLEIQNFNDEAYRYMLSGAYWYDTYYYDGGEDGEKGKDDTSLLADQACWWVYPFNRQILNNSHDGLNGKARTKKWVNYHYSAFNDYFGTASSSYQLKDAQQIYDVHQAVNLDTVWQKDKATYFGSCDTAYTNPVPLVGVVGGSNDPDENVFEQSLAISPHTNFKYGNNTYSSANLADIVPFTYASSNHFVLSLDQYNEKVASVFPKYFADETLLQSVKEMFVTRETNVYYELNDGNASYYLKDNPLDLEYSKPGFKMLLDEYDEVYHEYTRPSETPSSFTGIYYKNSSDIYVEIQNEDDYTAHSSDQLYYADIIKWNGFVNPITLEKLVTIEFIIGDGDSRTHYPNLSPYYYSYNDLSVVTDITKSQQFSPSDTNVVFLQSTRSRTLKESEINDFDDDPYNPDNIKLLVRDYKIPSSLIKDSTKPDACIEKYIKYGEAQNGDVRNYGIYDYGHVYIAQLERGISDADQVFGGTEESILLQNTWIPAGKSIRLGMFYQGALEYTEGDTYYQRYDCMKTYANTGSDVNQNIEVLSAMIQTRINLDGVYSVRGTVDNVDMNNTNTNLLNDAYSQDDNYFTYSITDPYISDITEYSNMFTWTLTKQPMSSKDEWLAVNLIAYYNATGSFGKITRIINYRNNLFCFQDNAISQIGYNERVALTPSDGVPIEIGNSGKVQNLNYISSNVGCQNRWSVVPSKSYLYWVDDRRAEIYRFGEGLEPFSTVNGFSDWVKANTYGEDWKPIKSTNVPITSYYDNNNDDIYFVTEKDCLAFNEKLNAFESFFSYEDSFILNSAGNTIVIKEQDTVVEENSDLYDGDGTWNNGIRGDGLSSIELMHEGEYNRFFGVQMPFYARFKVYPTDLQRDKIYTNLEFNLDAFDEKDIYLPDETFTRVRVWNEYQWGQWDFESKIYGTRTYAKRFRTHYVQLPRASYYPVYGKYENYNYLYNRELVWKQWTPTSSLSSNNALSNINASTINDRIRNPWTWLELYKENKSFVQTTVSDETDYMKRKNNLYIRRFTEVTSDNYILYDKLYKKVSEEYIVAVGNDLFAEAVLVADRSDYALSELYYINDNGEYKAIYNDTEYYFSLADDIVYNDTTINLYLLNYTTLYKEDYICCANNFNFANVTYYELKNSNSRVEIHDIILKYFEA